MKYLFVSIQLFALITIVSAKEVKLWDEGRITPEQPFPAKVIGAIPSWGGAIVILQEEGGDEDRYCVANLIMRHFFYQIVESQQFNKKEFIKKGAIFIEPAVEVEGFSWSMGVHKIGRTFGEDDFVAQWHEKSKLKREPKLYIGNKVTPHPNAEGIVKVSNQDYSVILEFKSAKDITFLQNIFLRAEKVGNTETHLKSSTHKINFLDSWLIDINTGEVGILSKTYMPVYRLRPKDLEAFKKLLKSKEDQSSIDIV